jgi:S1-C subfamily serine protease
MIDAFAALSDAVAVRVRAAAPLIVGVEWGTCQQISAVLWGDGIAVTSEQSLPEMESYTAILPGGARVAAMPVGRDASTNLAALRLEATAPPPPQAPDDLAVGALVLALGSDGAGASRARLGAIETLGAAWQSQCGGRIDRLIRLDIRLGQTAEGGPVLDSRGALLGMSTFGPRSQVLVIPTATIARVVAQLTAHGRVPRGWLGIGVQPVQIPREMEQEAGAGSGLMVLSIAEGAPAAGILLPGDILIAAGAAALPTPRALTALLEAGAIGTQLALRLMRGGVAHHCHVVIAARSS